MNISGLGSVPLLPFRTVLRYVATGLVGWLLSGVALFWAAPSLATGAYSAPKVLFLVHVMVLGWATMLAQGAIYQLLPVAFQVGIRHRTLGTFNYWIYTIGVIGMVASFPAFWLPGLQIFGGFVVLAMVLFVYNVIHSLMAVTNRGPMFGFVWSAVSYLALTVLLGGTLVYILSTGSIGHLLPAFLVSHIWLGLIGWFTILIMGFSYKLFPMFTLAHAYSEKRQKWILLVMNLAVMLSIIGAFSGIGFLSIAGNVSLLAGLLLFGADLIEIYKHRMRGKLETPMVMAVTGVVWLILLAVTALVFQLANLSMSAQVMTLFGFLFFIAWLSQTVIGYAYKIVPFLVWNERYAEKVGREPVPLLKDMVNERLIQWVLGSYNAGIIFTGAGILAANVVLVYVGVFILAATVFIFFYQMMKIILPPKK